jgi:hypothetical protein
MRQCLVVYVAVRVCERNRKGCLFACNVDACAAKIRRGMVMVCLSFSAAEKDGPGGASGAHAKMTGKEAAHAMDEYWKEMPTEVLACDCLPTRDGQACHQHGIVFDFSTPCAQLL